MSNLLGGGWMAWWPKTGWVLAHSAPTEDDCWLAAARAIEGGTK